MSRLLAQPRSLIAPNWARTFVIPGDLHGGKNGQGGGISPRMEAMRAGFNHQDGRGPIWAAPAALLHPGDLIEGQTGTSNQIPATNDEQVALIKPWWESWESFIKRVCFGNHDDNDPYSQAIMAAKWGQLENDYFDLDWCRIINASYVGFGGTTREFVEDTCASTDLPCVWLMHLPPRGQISPDARNLDITTLQMTIGQNAEFEGVVANHPNLKALFTGHCHAYWNTNGMISSRTVGGNKIALGNASAVTYVGQGPDWLTDPMMALVATLSEDESSMEFRWRNLSAERWANYFGNHVTTITGI